MHPLEFVDIVILALVEGVADVLPIDATGHALFASWLFHWRAGAIGVSIHFGAALALTVYLWREMSQIGSGLWKLRRGRVEPGIRLLAKALLTAAPYIIASSFLDIEPAKLSSLALVGGITIACAVAMGIADGLCMTVKRIEHLSAAGALLLGLAQLLALIPGVGRVAAAVTMGRVLGIERPAAFRFILLSSVPVLLATGGKSGFAYLMDGVRPTATDFLALAITFALVLLAVAIGTSWIRRMGLLPFTLYRLVMGGLLVGSSFL